MNLFSDDGSNPAKPFQDTNVNNEDVLKLKSESIDNAILGEYVKQVQIPIDTSLVYPNYIIDFRKAKKFWKHQIESLYSMLVEGGDVAIYVWVGNGLEMVGTGLSYKLDRIIAAGVESVFNSDKDNGKCVVYRGDRPDVPLKVMEVADIRGIRLDL